MYHDYLKGVTTAVVVVVVCVCGAFRLMWKAIEVGERVPVVYFC